MTKADEWEGLDGNSSDGWGDYPLDAVFVRTETRTVSEVVRRINGKRYVLDPDFQRDFVWTAAKQSKLIESCVMRIPLPVFYVAEAKDGRIIVVDGLQRLTTFVRFLSDQLKLTGLETSDGLGKMHILERKKFSELALNLQERIQDTQLTMYILDAKAPERARLDIFERVNSGEPLTRQQMRNALYNGPATMWLKEAAASDEFRSTTGQSLNDKTMRDREAINRFCAFKLLGYQSYTSGDMDAFLGKGLNQLEKLSDSERDGLLQSFKDAMKLNRLLFKEHAFRKSLINKIHNASRSVINIALFEICAVLMSERRVVKADKAKLAKLREDIVKLLSDNSFNNSITYSTNSTAAVQLRFRSLSEVLDQALEVSSK